jgi:hypothetical protein
LTHALSVDLVQQEKVPLLTTLSEGEIQVGELGESISSIPIVVIPFYGVTCVINPTFPGTSTVVQTLFARPQMLGCPIHCVILVPEEQLRLEEALARPEDPKK